MKGKLLLLVVAFFLFTSISLVNTGADSLNKHIDSRIYSSFQNTDQVQVFIMFNQSSNANLAGFNFKGSQANEAANLLGKGKVKHDYGTFVSALINSSDLDKLYSDNGVQSVNLVGTKHIFLQDSVPLIEANYTWPLTVNGTNLNGTGQTVCIVDTGVDYTHPDLGGCYGNNNPSSSCKIIGGYNFINNTNNPMDDNGHGTHVSGIVAASGAIYGVAPGAKIVAVKVCDASGNCNDNNIIAGIDWCIGNATLFNISVISMSLGGTYRYGTYCDNNYTEDSPFFAAAINSAIFNNISVTVAAGNDGSSNFISSPACVQNATAVGSTTKGDSISSSSNRGSLMSLFAPGENINSTWFGGGYHILSGTSMATPHVAAAFAIAKEYLTLSKQYLAPKQIESVFNKTGKTINDPATKLNYSRINIYNAIIYLDNSVPNVTLVSPLNSSLPLNANQASNESFNCSAISLALKNMTFYLWNSTGSIINQTSQNVSGSSASVQVNITNLSFGNYQWNCLYYDQNNNFSFSQNNFTLFRDPFVNLSYPSNNFISNNSQNFTCNVSSSRNLKNMTFYLWNSTGLEVANFTNITGISNGTAFQYNFTHEDNYQWNCLAYNNNSNSNLGYSNYSLIYEINPSNISLIQPYPQGGSSNSLTEIFYYNVNDDLNVSSCSLIINGITNQTALISNQSLSSSFTQTFSPGIYNWSINCTNIGLITSNSSSQMFTISAPSSQTGNGGGGSSGGGGSGGSGGLSNSVASSIPISLLGHLS